MMKHNSLLVFIVVLCLSSLSFVSGDFCHGSPDPDAPQNNHPITQPTAKLVAQVPNGMRFSMLVDDNEIPVVHLWGTPYEKGFAHGTLMKSEINDLLYKGVWPYIERKLAHALNHSGIPADIVKDIADVGLRVLLDWTSEQTEPFTGSYFDQELQGMADAANISFVEGRRVQMIGELTKGSCSMFGSWGPALDPALKSNLLTMRALDWSTSKPGDPAPFQNYHQLTVYHADTSPNSTELTFVNVGWSGWIGSISGVNEAQLSIHEIGVFFSDDTFGAISTEGIPFTYILRDILQFDSHRLDALSRIATAHRTCDLILGVGDGKDPGAPFNSIEYSASVCGIMDDTNQRPVADWHPRINHTVYHAMDWDCPGYNKVLGAHLQSSWGQINPAIAIRDLIATSQTGNHHVYLADLTNQQLYVSFAAPDSSPSVDRLAYQRQYAQIDLPSLFAVAQD